MASRDSGVCQTLVITDHAHKHVWQSVLRLRYEKNKKRIEKGVLTIKCMLKEIKKITLHNRIISKVLNTTSHAKNI